MKKLTSRIFALSMLVTLAPLAQAQQLTRQNVATILGFENGSVGVHPARWGGNATQECVTDADVVHSGNLSARIERTATDNSFFTLVASIPADFSAQRVELRGFVKTENVRDFVALWIRFDGPAGTLAFDTLQTQNINGTTGWTEYSVQIPMSSEARSLAFGFLLAGPGKAWVDTLQLLADGKPIAQAPDRAPTILETDVEFSAGSRVAIESLTDLQIENLARLAKVWGFIKYHHPAVTTGKRHWDFDLFRIMPAVLAAESAADASGAMIRWIENLGEVPECTACASLSNDELDIGPEIAWIDDAEGLGDGLSAVLKKVHRNRLKNPQFFVQLNQGVGNPNFERELNYSALRAADSGYQLLGLFRMWNMMRYFNPNREIMSEPGENPAAYWDRVLRESIEPFALGRNVTSYQQNLLRLIAKINDTHSNLWSGLGARPPMGLCQLPVDTRFVEGKAIVTRNSARNPLQTGPLRPGDLILRLDGKSTEEIVDELRPYYAASNEPTRMRDIGIYFTRGECGKVQLTIDRDGTSMDMEADRILVSTIDTSRWAVRDVPGPVFRKLDDDVAYLKLSAVRSAEAESYISRAEGTKGLIIDIRNYPSEFVVFSLGGRLIQEPADFVLFTGADLSNPGAFHFRGGAKLLPIAPRYTGKVVILVDEVSQSQAEYTAMAFRTAPGAIVIGSTTAGADGNVSLIPLPYGQSSYISGIGIYYPDKRPTQRVGIIPDVEVKPTIAGIRAGLDELIEEAIRRIRE